MKGFLYGKTEYDMLNNAVHFSSYIEQAKKMGFDFLSITDPKLYASYKFYKACIDNGIKPVIGIEIKFADVDNLLSSVLLYAKNNNGYKYLLSIEKEINEAGISDINKYLFNKDILYVFPYFNSYIERLFEVKDFNMIEEYISKISADNTYIGISYTNKIYKNNEVKLMEEYLSSKNVLILPIHEMLYLDANDEIIYTSLKKIEGFDVKLDEFDDYSFLLNPNNDARVDSFVNKIELNLFNEKIELPKYMNTKGATSKEYLSALAHKGLYKRGLYNKEYIERLEYELDVIDKMGYNDYFLIVWDFILYSKKNGILVGPGRGSACGSLVTYCLGITEIDPIKYNLFFERFLNIERVSMPDIDTDFPDDKRDDVIKYVLNTYGANHVSYISAFSRFQVKSSVKELSKIFNLDKARVDKILDMLDKHSYDELIKSYEDNKTIHDFLYVARGIEGLPHHISTHAAGIILSSYPLDTIIPLTNGLNGLYQSEYEAQDLEKIGLLKMDFLGISNLTMINDIINLIGMDYNDLRNIPLNDKDVFNMFSKGDTLGIFQFESKGITSVCMRLKPKKFLDIVALNALYRPGPMEYISDFIERAHGKQFEYIHNDLEPILKETYGIIVYQEQIMQIARKFAGYTFSEADILRRAISKKKEDVLDEIKPKFIEGSMKMGYSFDIAMKIYDMIYKFASYGFNKSHSVAYAYFAYQMAYLKCHHLNSFMSIILNNVINNKAQTISYIRYARKKGIITLKPNINVSGIKYNYEANRLFMPLTSIFGIGLVQANSIIDERNKNGIFKNFFDFKSRCTFLSQSNIEALIYSGALDIFGETKNKMLNFSNENTSIMMKYIDVNDNTNSELELSVLREMELKYLGFNITYDIFNSTDKIAIMYKCISSLTLKYNVESSILGYFTNIKRIKTKKNEMMYVMDLECKDSSLKATIFPKQLSLINTQIKANSLYVIKGKLQKDNRDMDSFIISELILLD